MVPGMLTIPGTRMPPSQLVDFPAAGGRTRSRREEEEEEEEEVGGD